VRAIRVTPEQLDAVRCVIVRADVVHIPELAARARVSPRIARAAVRELVLKGYPIITLNDGYRLAESASELRVEAASLRHRATEIMARAVRLDRTAAAMDGHYQQELIPLIVNREAA
jgi:hypothetical protein